MTTMSQQSLALQLFDAGAILLGGPYRLKNGSDSPYYLNFRTPENSKPGPLTPEIIWQIGHEMCSAAFNLPHEIVAGIPNASTPLAEAFKQASGPGHYPV